MVQQLQDEHQIEVLLWDESVIEKSESIYAQGMCAVHSSKVKRLKRIKPSFLNPPGGLPVRVPGFEWIRLLLAGLKTHPTVAFFRWYTTRGEYAQDRLRLQTNLLDQAVKAFGQELWHVFDRGYGGNRWLGELIGPRVQFVISWPKRYQLIDEKGLRNAWKMTQANRPRHAIRCGVHTDSNGVRALRWPNTLLTPIILIKPCDWLFPKSGKAKSPGTC